MRVEFFKYAPCPECEGHGAFECPVFDMAGHLVDYSDTPCPYCDGTGSIGYKVLVQVHINLNKNFKREIIWERAYRRYAPFPDEEIEKEIEKIEF